MSSGAITSLLIVLILISIAFYYVGFRTDNIFIGNSAPVPNVVIGGVQEFFPNYSDEWDVELVEGTENVYISYPNSFDLSYASVGFPPSIAFLEDVNYSCTGESRNLSGNICESSQSFLLGDSVVVDYRYLKKYLSGVIEVSFRINYPDCGSENDCLNEYESIVPYDLVKAMLDTLRVSDE